MHAAFLAAIADRPDDDLPRLVYADYLDENGDNERAEFIRVQIELSNLPHADPRRDALLDRGRELLRAHKAEWVLAEFGGRSQEFRRGFVERVNVPGEWLIAHPDSLLAPGPLREVRIVSAAQFTDRLARIPGLARIEALDLSNTQFGGPPQVRNLFAAARLDNLRKLVLRNCNFWEDEEVRALADTPVAGRLTELDLSGNRIADVGLRAIAELPAFSGLEVFRARADGLDQYSAAHAAGAGAVANSATLTRLKSLDLSDHYIGDEGLALLVSSPNAASLERLAVEYNEIGEIGDTGVEAVVNSSRLVNLRELLFGGNRLGPLGAEALAAWPHLERMRLVDLSGCELSDLSRSILRRSRWAEKFVF